MSEQATPSGYRDYLRSPHWRNVRKAYRASGRLRACIVCDEAKFDLHHITYERIGRERLDDLLPLCRRCHDEVHAHADRENIPICETHRILLELYFLEPLQIKERLHPSRQPKSPAIKVAKVPTVPHVKAGLKSKKTRKNRPAKKTAKAEAKKDAERSKRFRKYFVLKAM